MNNNSSSSSIRLKPFGQLESLSASAPWAIFPRKKLDVTYRDIGAGLAACLQLRERQRSEYEQKITKLWNSTGQTVVTLSIRYYMNGLNANMTENDLITAFDLLLQTLKLPVGSEVLCSAITIPDMMYVLRYHALVPVPVDVDPKTLAVNVKLLKEAVTDKTKMIVIAHIFGSRCPLDEVLEVARNHDLLVVEDCAQAFMGMQYTGENRADVSMFSFGTIKTATSFGGAVIHVKNPVVLEEMRRRERRYPCHTNVSFFKKLMKYGVLHGISTPALYGLFIHACRAVGGVTINRCCWCINIADHDKVITSAIRGFSGGELVSLIQYRPSMALLGLMHHRLTCIDEQYIRLRKSKSEQLATAIKDLPNVFVRFRVTMLRSTTIGCSLFVFRPRKKFGFRLLSTDHVGVLERVLTSLPVLRSWLTCQGTIVGSILFTFSLGRDHDPVHAKNIMARYFYSLVYLPVTPETPEWAIERMTCCLRDALRSSSRL
ncbi:hypothetical protein DD237_003783 [Peronospora effusa]|uniref:Aminotransferase class V domain-containing protein n=1 Tax=Peronospora effusa TaxID=542832 RepID=A0A425C958_9STRA|nr:hypothetical protein DD237_003783 [Peronospora effusa]